MSTLLWMDIECCSVWGELPASEDDSWPSGSVPTDWRCNISSPCRGVSYETGSLPGVEQSPGPGIRVIHAKSMAPARPDAHVATGQICPLKVHHTGT